MKVKRGSLYNLETMPIFWTEKSYLSMPQSDKSLCIRSLFSFLTASHPIPHFNVALDLYSKIRTVVYVWYRGSSDRRIIYHHSVNLKKKISSLHFISAFHLLLSFLSVQLFKGLTVLFKLYNNVLRLPFQIETHIPLIFFFGFNFYSIWYIFSLYLKASLRC